MEFVLKKKRYINLEYHPMDSRIAIVCVCVCVRHSAVGWGLVGTMFL